MSDGGAARRDASPARWIGRAAIGLAALTGAYFAATHALANVLKDVQPDQAFALAPWDGQVAARYARTLIPTDLDAAQTTRADAVARTALRREVTALDALATLGLDAQIRGQDAVARRYLALAQRLSRRDVQVEFWAIEDAVGRSDVAQAVRHYDIALRTSPESRQLLFPVLAEAIADPAIASAMTRLLATRPYWTPDFIFYLAKDAPDPVSAAAFFDRLYAANVPIGNAPRSVLISSLIARGEVERAWSVYAARQPGTTRMQSRDPRFLNDQDSRSAFDWQTFGNGGTSTAIERDTDGNVLTFSVPPGGGGLLARQLLLLTPGSYALRSRTSGIALPATVRPMWTLTCLDGRAIGQVPLANSADANGMTTGRLTVGTDCPAQYLSLMARPSDIAVQGSILEIDVRPLR